MELAGISYPSLAAAIQWYKQSKSWHMGSAAQADNASLA